MKKRAIAVVALISMTAFAGTTFAGTAKGEKINGKKKFEEHCAVCHEDGGNTANPAKTLSKKDREANGIKNAMDVVGYMRKPGPGMTQFDKKTLSDKEAKAIADYIIKTYK